jgi:long-chain fatty acid transport protein
MKKFLILGSVVVAAVSSSLAAGFGLYESSSAATALGGALMGKAYDASANTVNPATLTDIDRMTLQVGFVTEHPRSRQKFFKNGVQQGGSQAMDPGFFVLPHLQFAMPLPADLAFGIGVTPEYGLGTEYSDGNPMNWSSQEVMIEGIVINPNVAYKITDKWSVGAGIRWLYFNFEQDSKPYIAPGLQANHHLRGHNSFRNFAGRFGTSYKLRDNFSVGATYQMRLNTNVKGHSSARYTDPLLGPVTAWGSAKANLALPQSASIGYNWDITDKWHLGNVLTWTDWSELDTLTFKLPTGDKGTKLGWKDTWRIGTGLSWDFAEDWTAMTSYVYDMSAPPSDQHSIMLPPGDRHLLSWGLAWRMTDNLELGFNYGIILMQSSSMHTTESVSGDKYAMETHRGLSHAAGGTITYRF